MGVDDSTLASGDANFLAGQRGDAEALKDKGTGTGPTFVPDWDPAFLQDIHAVVLVSGDSHNSVNKELKQVKSVFGVGSAKASIKEVKSIVGDVRPGKEAGHEQYDYFCLVL
jgi:hypothetical protein